MNLVVVQSTATPLIYQDTFNRNGIFNGSTPTFQNGTNNAWVGPTGVSGPNCTGEWTTATTGGGQAQELAGDALYNDDFSGYLPFSPSAGHVYTLSVQMSITAATDPNHPTAPNNFFEMGFGSRGDEQPQR